MSLESWAQAQLGQLLPLDEDSLQQIVAYSNSQPPEAAANHLKDILGDSDLAAVFITEYASKRAAAAAPASRSQASDVAAHRPASKKKAKAQFNRLPAVRRPEDYGDTSGAYH